MEVSRNTPDPQPNTLQVALTYWPRRSAYRWWQAFDRGELREDIEQIRSLGIDTVRISVPWEEAQPAPTKINGQLLRLLERALDELADAGLHTIVTLFGAATGGALFVPRWIANPDPLSDLLRIGAVGTVIERVDLPPVISEGGYRANQARDLFRDTAVIEAQRYQINEVVGYFGSHPAIQIWQLGEGLELVHPPASEEAIAEWYTTMAEATNNAYNGARILGVVTARGLLNHAGPRPEQIAASCDIAGIALDAPLPLPEFRLDSPDAIEFVYTLASSLAGRRLAAVGLGLPTAPDSRPQLAVDVAYGERITTSLASGQRQSEFLAQTFERLRQLGAPLVVLADYSDYPGDLWRVPPLDQSVRWRTLGLLDVRGREKPAADSVRAFERSSTGGVEALSFEVDPERYWRSPESECARLWRAFMRER